MERRKGLAAGESSFKEAGIVQHQPHCARTEQSSEENIMNRFTAGALSGLVATVPMTMVMTALWKRLPQPDRYPLPPRDIIESASSRVSTKAACLSDGKMAGLSLMAHFAYGAATGALYPLFCPEPRKPLLSGAGYGVAIWVISYLGFLPAFHILKPATQHPPSRNRLMVVSHLVWGAVTALMVEKLCNKRRGVPQCTEKKRSDAIRFYPETARDAE